jgi:hypothetical protein
VADHLWPLLRLKANTETELKQLYRKAYLETYIRDADGNEIEIYDWHGRRVRFHARTFDHAFSASSNYRFGDGFHDLPFSNPRARCIPHSGKVFAKLPFLEGFR